MPHGDDKKKKQLERYNKHGVHKGTANIKTRVSDRTKRMRKESKSLAERNIARMMNKVKNRKDTQSVKKDLMKGNL